ncbi:hypothetical protein U1Q18_005370 [Sarracenia purpurea var. burkii]
MKRNSNRGSLGYREADGQEGTQGPYLSNFPHRERTAANISVSVCVVGFADSHIGGLLSGFLWSYAADLVDLVYGVWSALESFVDVDQKITLHAIGLEVLLRILDDPSKGCCTVVVVLPCDLLPVVVVLPCDLLTVVVVLGYFPCVWWG